MDALGTLEHWNPIRKAAGAKRATHMVCPGQKNRNGYSKPPVIEPHEISQPMIFITASQSVSRCSDERCHHARFSAFFFLHDVHGRSNVVGRPLHFGSGLFFPPQPFFRSRFLVIVASVPQFFVCLPCLDCVFPVFFCVLRVFSFFLPCSGGAAATWRPGRGISETRLLGDHGVYT